MNKCKNILSFVFVFSFAAVVFLFVESFLPKPHHIHENTLDKIDYKNTWRVDISPPRGSSFQEIGVCKTCGKITDIKAGDAHSFSHFPVDYPLIPQDLEPEKRAYLAGFKQGQEAKEQEAYERISKLISGWSFYEQSAGYPYFIEESKEKGVMIIGPQNREGRLVVLDTNGLETFITVFPVQKGGIVVLQGLQ